MTRRLRYAPACEHTRAGRPMHGKGLCGACYERERTTVGFVDAAELIIGPPPPPRRVGAYVPSVGFGDRHAATDCGVAAWTAAADADAVAAFVAGPLADLADAATWAEARAWAAQQGKEST
jgi:hypothetical protein